MGVPAEWVPVLHKVGVYTVELLAAVDKAAKLQQELQGVNKKYKLELAAPSIDQIEGWIEAAKSK